MYHREQIEIQHVVPCAVVRLVTLSGCKPSRHANQKVDAFVAAEKFLQNGAGFGGVCQVYLQPFENGPISGGAPPKTLHLGSRWGGQTPPRPTCEKVEGHCTSKGP